MQPQPAIRRGAPPNRETNQPLGPSPLTATPANHSAASSGRNAALPSRSRATGPPVRSRTSTRTSRPCTRMRRPPSFRRATRRPPAHRPRTSPVCTCISRRGTCPVATLRTLPHRKGGHASQQQDCRGNRPRSKSKSTLTAAGDTAAIPLPVDSHRSSSAMSLALCQRASGSLARHFRTSRSRPGGVSGGSPLMGSGSLSRMAAIRLACESPANARRPAVIS